MNKIANKIRRDGKKARVLSVIRRNSHKGTKVKQFSACFKLKNLYILYCIQHNASEVQEEFLEGVNALVEDGELHEVNTESINGEKHFTYICLRSDV